MADSIRKLLIDSFSGTYEPEWGVSAEDVHHSWQPSEWWSVEKSVLKGGRQHGVDIVSVDNGVFSFDIIPTRGMGIQEGYYEGIRLGWDSPVGEVVHPQYVAQEELGGLGWLRGFSEWMVRCGMTNNGGPGIDKGFDNQGREVQEMKTLHGRVANTPASTVMVSIELSPPHTIRVCGTVIESRLFGENLMLETIISTVPGSNSLSIQDRITNCRGVPAEMQMLYHINYGPPLLEAGSRVLLPAEIVSPRDPYDTPACRKFDRYGAPTPGLAEKCFFAVPKADRKGRCLHGLRNQAGDLAVSHQYDLASLPCLTIWKNEAALEDGYVTGLEPGTNYPNHISFERKKRRTRKLRPGSSWNSEITVSVHSGRKAVSKLTKQVAAVQGRKKTEILLQPDRKLSM